MRRTGTAFFVFHPRTIEEVRRIHDVLQERPYRIKKTIALGLIDYENFVTDMLVDRPFLEAHASLCVAPGDCLYIKRRGAKEGVLVVPEGAWVKAAAWVVERQSLV